MNCLNPKQIKKVTFSLCYKRISSQNIAVGAASIKNTVKPYTPRGMTRDSSINGKLF